MKVIILCIALLGALSCEAGRRWRPQIQNVSTNDNFNRADGALGANWSHLITGFTDATASISGNKAVEDSSDHAFYYWNAGSFGNNQWAQATLKGTPSLNVWQGVILRGGANNKCYFFYEFNGLGRMESLTNGAFSGTLAITGSSSWVDGDIIRAEVWGSNPTRIRMMRNGVQQLIFEDWATRDPINSGSAGIAFGGGATGLSVDDWSAGNLDNTTPTSITDNFNRPDGSLATDTNWFKAASQGNAPLDISGNKVVIHPSAGTGSAYWFGNGTVFNSDQYAQAKMTFASGEWVALAARVNVSTAGAVTGEYYALILNNNSFYLRAYNGGDNDLIAGDTSVTWSNGDTMKLIVTGTNPVHIEVDRNGSSVYTYDDSTYKFTGGRPGLEMFSSGSASIDDFAAGNYP